MKNKLFQILILGSLLSLIGCGSTDEGQKCADVFFDLMVQEKFDSAANMLDNISFNDSNNINTLKQFRDDSGYGELISAEKNFGFSTNYKNGITTVELPYNLKYKDGQINSQVTIIDRGEGFKIYSIE